MAKRRQNISKRSRARRSPQRQTNWLVVGSVVGVGLLILGGLMWLAWQPPASNAFSLSDYCLENESNCVTVGQEAAPVTVVEVSDYGCSHCRNFNLQTAPLIEETYVDPGLVRWVIVPYALGPQTLPAAAAALCAAEQDAFQPFHKAMFEIQTTDQALTRAGFMETAAQLGLDVDQFATCIDGNKYNGTVQANSRAANQAGVSGTPTFFIDGAPVEGERPFVEFQQRINRLLN